MILHRYLFREVTQTFIGVLSVLLLIFVSHRFVRYLADAAAGDLPSDVIVQLLALKMIATLVIILPLAFFIAVLLGLSRLHQDSEVTAMTAGGLGLGQFMQAIFWFSLGFALIGLGLSLYASPKAAELAGEIKGRAEASADITGMIAGRFNRVSGGDRVFYAETISPDRARMENVFVQLRDRQPPFLLSAASGYQRVDEETGDRFLVLVDGRRYEGEPGQYKYTVTRFREHAVRIKENLIAGETRKNDTIPTLELLASDNREWAAEFQWRLSMPLSLVLLGLLAVLLARTSPRQGRYARLFNAILLYFVYNNLLGITRELTEQGEIPTAIGVWPVHLGMALFIAALALYQASGRWWLAAFRRRRREARA